MKRQKILIILMLAMFILLTSCDDSKTDDDELVVETRVDFAYDFPYTVNGEEHSYIKYEESSDTLLSVKLPRSSYTCGELIHEEERYSIYEAQEAELGEAVVKKYTASGEEETLTVCRFTDFESVEEILGFFRITSPDSITSVDVYTRSYNEKNDSFDYVFYGTFDDIGGEVYELLSTMEKDFIAKKYYIAGEATAEKRKSWADGVIKLDVTLTSGIVLPVFYSETTDCVAIMDSVSDFSGRPDETATESLKAAVGLS